MGSMRDAMWMKCIGIDILFHASISHPSISINDLDHPSILHLIFHPIDAQSDHPSHRILRTRKSMELCQIGIAIEGDPHQHHHRNGIGDLASPLRKLVHRDIAARNVLLSSTLQAKIADFGLSRVLESPTDTGHTVSMTGPLRHMAPESIRVQEYSPASDSWMWGVMMFETLTATVPYSDLSPLQAATEVVLGRRLELPEQIAKEWPLLIPLIRGCFATKPDDRPSMHTICQHLSRNFSRKQTM
eukprot:TRINITY_DN3304_c0_g2_i2.p1 TRINITY_DN3304_c0_g2~~TRINITY_DN3304_c0_g2_i2.p1  ORF type:complete len:244 (+),score=47.95 TRINITY_DN3304_c0_g2_i2:74-805(+)